MIQVRIEGKLTRLERLRFVARSASMRRRITRQIGQRIQSRLRAAIRKRVRQSADQFPDARDRAEKARAFAKLVRFKATADRVLLFDGDDRAAPQRGDNATAGQARKLRELGFRLPAAYIQRRFSQGLAGMIIRELESGKSTRGKRRRSGSLVMLVWRKEHQEIIDQVDVTGIVRRALAA